MENLIKAGEKFGVNEAVDYAAQAVVSKVVLKKTQVM